MPSPDASPLPPPVPIPVQALAHSFAFDQRRPGLITAIGVMSIVIGCLSGFFSFFTGVEAFGFFVASRMMATMSGTMATRTSTPTLAFPPAKPTLSPANAPVAVNTIQKMLSLDPAHLRELDRLMRKHGREVLGPDADESLSAADVRAAIIAKTPAPTSGTGPASFTTNEGSVSIFADHATFTRADGTETVNTSARSNSDSVSSSFTATNSYTATKPNTALSAAQMNQVIAAVNAAAPIPLNSLQLRSLRTQLSAPGQALVTPGTSVPVSSVFVQRPGNATIIFDTGNTLVLGSAGQVISAGNLFPKFKVSGASVGTVVAEAAVSLGLAIYLFIVGIITLRGVFMVPRLLRIYCWIKIPLALVAAPATTWMSMDFMMSATSNAPAGTAPRLYVFAILGGVAALLGLAYPVGLLIALRARTVKDYYDAVMN